MACPFSKAISFGDVDENENEDLTYSKYLQLKPLLSCTEPKTSFHDEHLFIVVHQVYELWFKQIIFELDSVRNIFLQPSIGISKMNHNSVKTHPRSSFALCVDERNMLIVNTRLLRITKIFAVLVDQIKILETMTPLDFADFRGELSSSSGFQSWQFRVIENKIGMKKENRINYNKGNYSVVFKDEEVQKLLQLSENQPSLFDLVEAWLERTPGLKNESFDFWKEFERNCFNWFSKEKETAENTLNPKKREHLMNAYQKNKDEFLQILIEENYEVLRKKGDRRLSWNALQGAMMIYFYRDEVMFHEAFQMLTLLMDIDGLITNWRSNHVLLVQRQLGTKSGSGGSSGYRYLRSTVSDRYKVFLDLFNLSNYLIPREFIPVFKRDTGHQISGVSMPYAQ